MTDVRQDFIDALAAYVRGAVERSGGAADYCTEAVRVIDARNHIFRPVPRGLTDEAADTYALRELCRVDEATLELAVDFGRLASVAGNYF